MSMYKEQENMNQPLVSIVIPVYNVEEELTRCMDSVLNQSYKHCEIILVDDGSKDQSGSICDTYAQKMKNVQCIHTENKGQSAARNLGIKMANGKYLLFVDSDDYIDCNTVNKMVEVADVNECDIVVGDYYEITKDSLLKISNCHIQSNLVYDGKDYLIENFTRGGFLCSPVMGLYRLEFLKQNELYFKEGIYHEDELWAPQLYLAANRVTHIDFPFYYYCFRENSTTNQKDETKILKRSNDIIQVCNILYDKYKCLDRHSRNVLNDYLCTVYFSALYIAKRTDANRIFGFKTANSFVNYGKSVLYLIAPKIYLKLNPVAKRILKIIELFKK